MRYAVISDVHSNIEALSNFFEKAATLDIGAFVCLGDIVGYSPNPNECIDLLRKKKARCIMGNHDSRAAGLQDESDFNLIAAEAIRWTRGVLTDENKEFLKNLPATLLVDNKFLAVHGWIKDTDEYIISTEDVMSNFKILKEEYKTNLCFFGHTHVAIAYGETNGKTSLNTDAIIEVSKGSYYLINPGSIGQPRDRDPRSSFVVYDSKKSTVTYHRIEYDIQATADKIIAAGLSQRLAERLKLGW